LAVQTFAEQERRLSAGVETPPTSLLTANLVDQLEGILTAPVSATTELQVGLQSNRTVGIADPP
jgi:hypothetical protein